jgi:hypothetical protein
MTEVPSTEKNYNSTRNHYFNPYHGIMSYEDRNEGCQLTCNMVHKISLEGIADLQHGAQDLLAGGDS